MTQSLTITRRQVAALGAGLLLSRSPALASARQASGPYTFAVIGTDYRTPQDAEMSDVLMVSRVDPAAGTVRTLSIPRDTYAEIPGYGWAKINAAYNLAISADPNRDWRAAAQATMDTITHNFGITFDGVAQTDMAVFPRIIDALGGVTVENPYELTHIGFAEFPAGEITLTGEEAIRFCRTRQQDGDGGRVMRQHLVLQAILAQLQDPAMITKVPDLITTLTDDAVRYDIPADIQAQLLVMLPTLDPANVVFGNIDDQLSSGYTDSGAWIYQADWSTLPGYVQSWLAGE